MSTANSIARGGQDRPDQADTIGLVIPPELESRYDVRLVEGEGGEQRIGLFRPGDRATPAIEVTADRIMTRREDVETVESLIRIAQHNGWSHIDVDGSPEFRKAVWTAASREGLAVDGYEPSFVERERSAALRRDSAEARDASPAAPAPADPEATIPARSASAAVSDTGNGPELDRALSEPDSRLLLKVSALTEDRKALYGGLRGDLEGLQRDVQYERIDNNRDALTGALERALSSPTLVKAFERAGYEPDTLRTMGRGGEWDTEIADAIYLTRSGQHRDTLVRDAGARAILADQIETDADTRAAAELGAPEGSSRSEPPAVRDELARSAETERRRESDELAELFLHGAAEKMAADPRLAGALQAQASMEQHIAEVFDGDATRTASASRESRQMISDALRRGLEVSAREPTPVRQIEPAYARPDLER